MQVLQMTKTQPIGIFDSGIGGLTIVKSLEKELPHERFIYFGDTAHMPYGEKSPEEILSYSKKIVEFLISKKVKLIVIACNSASSIAASQLRASYWQQVEIMGVIRPAIKAIIQKKIKSVGIIGTQATIRSNIYANLLLECDPNLDIYQKETPKLAPLIENGFVGDPLLDHELANYLLDPQFVDKEAILLACTHYPLISHQVDTFFKHQKQILDNAGPLAVEVRRYLSEKQLLASPKAADEAKVASNEFYVSKYSPNFIKNIQTFYNTPIRIEEIRL